MCLYAIEFIVLITSSRFLMQLLEENKTLSCLGTLSGITERDQITLSTYLHHITVVLVPTKLRWNLDKEKI